MCAVLGTVSLRPSPRHSIYQSDVLPFLAILHDARPHRCTQREDVQPIVMIRVCFLVAGVSCAKVAKVIEMLFRLQNLRAKGNNY